MNLIDTVNLVDGNQYIVNNTISPVNVENDFDSIYENEASQVSLDDIFNEVAQEYGVNVSLLKAVAQAESGFDASAVSKCGAMGMMQLMPATAQSLGVTDPFDAKQNITGGAKMLAYLLDDYDGNATLALAAYNAGAGSVKKYGGVPPYKETLNYIKKIDGYLGGALSNDSTKLSDLKATDFSNVASPVKLDIKYNENNSSVTDSDNANKNVTSTIQVPEDADSDDNNSLFSYSDYLKFLETYEDIIKRILSGLLGTESDDSNYDSSALDTLYDSGSDSGLTQDIFESMKSSDYYKTVNNVINSDLLNGFSNVSAENITLTENNPDIQVMVNSPKIAKYRDIMNM